MTAFCLPKQYYRKSFYKNVAAKAWPGSWRFTTRNYVKSWFFAFGIWICFILCTKALLHKYLNDTICNYGLVVQALIFISPVRGWFAIILGGDYIGGVVGLILHPKFNRAVAYAHHPNVKEIPVHFATGATRFGTCIVRSYSGIMVGVMRLTARHYEKHDLLALALNLLACPAWHIVV